MANRTACGSYDTALSGVDALHLKLRLLSCHVNWKRKRIFVSTALGHEALGFEHVADDLRSVFLETVLLGRIKEDQGRLSTLRRRGPARTSYPSVARA